MMKEVHAATGRRDEGPSPLMEQIYYTQCPIGYGLGASNGFQIKRRTPGYPISGDFRHLGMRAFPPGSRTLAPPSLRYRIADDGVAEVAFLTPRTHEYQTERGLWGRPGGHFAHGLRLAEDELARLQNWPAGLFGATFWQTSDPQPSRGRPPEAIEGAQSLLGRAPSFEVAAGLAARLDGPFLASILTALAAVARDGRTLVLIDRADRLADDMALLTLLIPAPWRSRLTFSTYHDRPDELPGYRIQGAIPDPRLNRPALRSLGVLADLISGTIEPALTPAPWALTLTHWLARQEAEDRRFWTSLERLSASCHEPSPPSSFPDDEWLNAFFDLPSLSVIDEANPPSWSHLADRTTWARGARLGDELAGARPAGWWQAQAIDEEAARRALVAHLQLPASWQRDTDGTSWGTAVAAWLDRCPSEMRQTWLGSVVEAAPATTQASFFRASLRASSPRVVREGLLWARSQTGFDSRALLPIEVRGVFEGSNAIARCRDILTRALPEPRLLIEVLDALAETTEGRPQQAREAAIALSQAMQKADDATAIRIVNWALDQNTRATSWLAPYLRSLGEGAALSEGWSAIDERIGPARRAEFARVALEVASEEGVEDFVWAVETLLLACDDNDRPHNPLWPGAYVDGLVSDLDLLQKLFAREFRDRGVRRWIDAARTRGELSEGQVDRIERCLNYARVLKSGDVRALATIELPSVPAEERGAVLAQILGRLGSNSEESSRLILTTCLSGWPGAFQAGAPGLTGIAEVFAERILSKAMHPETWLAALSAILKHLGLFSNPDIGFAPDSLAAEVLAATMARSTNGFPPWPLRQFILGHATAWRILSGDVRRELDGKSVPESVEIFEHWDQDLSKGLHTARFFEVWLNSCDGSTLATFVSARAEDLKTLTCLSWWRFRNHLGARDDLREAFARLAPIAPLDENALPLVQAWMRPVIRTSEQRPVRRIDTGASDDLVPLDGEVIEAPMALAPSISAYGQARWRSVEAISAFQRSGIDTEARWQTVEAWTRGLSLELLSDPDRDLLLSWLILGLDGYDGLRVARLAAWLVRSGMTDADSIAGWAERLGPWLDVSRDLRLSRKELVKGLGAEWKTVAREAGERSPKRGLSGSPGALDRL